MSRRRRRCHLGGTGSAVNGGFIVTCYVTVAPATRSRDRNAARVAFVLARARERGGTPRNEWGSRGQRIALGGTGRRPAIRISR